jgi:hypothetical protein
VPADTPLGESLALDAAPGAERTEAVLTDEDIVRDIARRHPDYGLMRVQKELRKPEYGSRELNPVQLYVLLRKLGLDTREGRESFAKTGQATPAAEG